MAQWFRIRLNLGHVARSPLKQASSINSVVGFSSIRGKLDEMSSGYMLISTESNGPLSLAKRWKVLSMPSGRPAQWLRSSVRC